MAYPNLTIPIYRESNFDTLDGRTEEELPHDRRDIGTSNRSRSTLGMNGDTMNKRVHIHRLRDSNSLSSQAHTLCSATQS